MNWSDIANTVSKVAPALGTALGGPTGAAIGTAISSVLGTSATPSDVQAALQADPQAAVKLKQIEADLSTAVLTAQTQQQQAQLDAETKQQAAINETMRAELSTDGWFKSGWRPAIGWVLAACFLMLGAALSWALLEDPSQLPSLMDGIVTLIVSASAVLGVNISKRSQDKQTAMTGSKPVTLMDAVATRIKK